MYCLHESECAGETPFDMYGHPRSFVLTQREKRTRKWAIEN